MSSRAVRKALKERQAQDLLRSQEDSSGDESHPEVVPQKSPFALLDGMDDDDDDGDAREDETDIDDPAVPAVRLASEQNMAKDTIEPGDDNDHARSAPTKRRRKKKTKQQNDTSTETTAEVVELDEIDAALAELRIKPGQDKEATNPTADIVNSTNVAVKSLSIDPAHLHVENEMRRLFGRAALNSDDSNDDQPGGRRRNRQQQQVGLGAAVGRRQGPAGRAAGLAAISLKRNVFVQGKEEWPRGTSEGLGMDVIKQNEDGTTEFSFTHSRSYRELQSEFATCVEMMDPELIVHLVHQHPYHISSLLQVSEIAKQQGDHTISGTLLERALFSFGRSVHGSFNASLLAGKARLDFHRTENRELWVAGTRYIANLSMRSTWRTVFEWSKLLLALDPEDPYCMSLVIDQYAIRARQPQQLIEMLASPLFPAWNELPNVRFTQALAYVQAGQESKGKQCLYSAVGKYPYIVEALCRELKVDAPASVWGKTPNTDWEQLMCDLYTTRAKDLWNTPEATALLLEVTSALSSELPDAPVLEKQIGRDICRHVLLTEQPQLIALLPNKITSQVRGLSDPLPPEDSLSQEDSDRPVDQSGPDRTTHQEFTQRYITLLHGMLGRTGQFSELMSHEDIRRWIAGEIEAGRLDDRFDQAQTDDHIAMLLELQSVVPRDGGGGMSRAQLEQTEQTNQANVDGEPED